MHPLKYSVSTLPCDLNSVSTRGMSLASLYRTITDLLKRFGYNREAKAPHKYGGYFRNDADHRDYVGIGTAAGQAFHTLL